MRQMLPLANDAPLTQPSICSWQGVSMEYHRQPPGECGFSLPLHAICLPLASGPVERRIGRLIHPSAVELGICSVYPAGTEPWIRWHGPLDFLLLSFDPTILVADESSDQPLELVERMNEVPDAQLTQIALAWQQACVDGATVASHPYIDALFHLFVAHVTQRYATTPPADAPRVTLLSPQQLRRVIDHMQDALRTPLALPELAALVHMSPFHFARVFHATVGQAPHQYILMLRIEHAKDLLRNQTITHSEIAIALGFADQAHFSRTFKRLTGVTPSTYQQQQRGALRKNIQDPEASGSL